MRGQALEFFKTLGNNQPASATAVITGASLDIYVAGYTSGDGLATAHALQPARAGGGDAFVAKYTSNGALVWFTYLGGSDLDSATGIALDSAGNVYVSGVTVSRDFPTRNALQPAIHASATGAGFVAKISADGSTLLYSTYLGGSAFDTVNAIAVDSGGSAYVTGTAASLDFPITNPIVPPATTRTSVFITKLAPHGSSLVYSVRLGPGSGHAIAVDAAGQSYVTGDTLFADFPVVNAAQPEFAGSDDAFVAKLDTAGAHLLYSTFVGGRGPQTGRAITVDPAGAAYVTGDTSSVDFPTLGALQPDLAAIQAAKSFDDGNTWTPITNGLTTTYPAALVIDPQNPAALYVPTYDFGILKSTNGGETWHAVNQGLPADVGVPVIAIDPSNSSVLYAAVSNAGVYKSTDGGNTWHSSSSGLPRFPLFTFFGFMPGHSSTLVVGGNGVGVYRSTDSGATWTMLNIDQHADSYLFDPKNPMNQYVGIASYFFSPGVSSPGAILKSTDGGQTFTTVDQSPPPVVDQLAGIDPESPAIIYGYTSGLTRSMDQGSTWYPIGPDTASYGDFGNLVIDAQNPATIYASGGEGIFRSTNRGDTWTRINPTVTPLAGARIGAVDPSRSATIYALGGHVNSDAFVTKFDAFGKLVYSTYFGGSGAEIAHGIAVDSHGMTVITGSTGSSDLPLVHPIQAKFAGSTSYDLGDMFIAVLSEDGRVLDFSTYLGGPNLESAAAVALDRHGSVIVAGQTSTTSLTQGVLAKIRRYSGSHPHHTSPGAR